MSLERDERIEISVEVGKGRGDDLREGEEEIWDDDSLTYHSAVGNLSSE